MSQAPPAPGEAHYLDGMPPHVHRGGQTVYTGNGGGGGADINQDDFASKSGLPEWAQSFIQNTSKANTENIWNSYQGSVNKIAQNPANVEKARQASQNQYSIDLTNYMDDAAKMAAIQSAARGTTNSSVGTDAIAKLAMDAVFSAQKQQAVNVGAAEETLKNKLDMAKTALGFSGLISDYLGKTEKSRTANFAGLDLNAGTTNPPSSPGYSEPLVQGQELSTNIPTDSKGEGKGPFGWTLIESMGGRQDRYETPQGQEVIVAWDPVVKGKPRTGTVYFVSGTWKSSGAGAVIDAESDLFKTEGLLPFSEEAIRGVTEKYGEKGFNRSVRAVNAVAKQGKQIDKYQGTLDKQYGGLSKETMSILRSALGSNAGGLNSYFKKAGNNEIMRAADIGRAGIANANISWAARTKNQNNVDSAVLNEAMAKQLGSYLGLAKYSYDPNWAMLQSMLAGPQT